MWYKKQGQKPMWTQDSAPQKKLTEDEKQRAREHWQLLLDKALSEDDFETAANMRDYIDDLKNR